MKHHAVRRYLIAGLLVWLPILATFLVIRFLIDLLDGTLSLLPHAFQPDQLLGFHLPGLGLVVSVIVLLLTGLIATNFFGRKLVFFGEAILSKIPLVRSIYNAVKQVAETILSSSGEAFRNVLLIEYPRKGLWSIAFQTGTSRTSIDKLTGEDMITIFVPTTPNPTSGYLMLIPKKDAINLDMSIDEALKMIISLGVVQVGQAKTST